MYKREEPVYQSVVRKLVAFRLETSDRPVLLHTISVTASIFVSFCKAGDCQSLSIQLNFVKPDILPADVRIY